MKTEVKGTEYISHFKNKKRLHKITRSIQHGGQQEEGRTAHARSPGHQSCILILGGSLELLFRELAVSGVATRDKHGVPDGKLLERNKTNALQKSPH